MQREEIALFTEYKSEKKNVHSFPLFLFYLQSSILQKTSLRKKKKKKKEQPKLLGLSSSFFARGGGGGGCHRFNFKSLVKTYDLNQKLLCE